MMLEIIVIMIIVIIFALLGIIFGVFMFGLAKPEKPITTSLVVPETIQPPLQYWTENGRGYGNVDQYPPCLNISTPARKLFSLMVANNTMDKYKTLFEVMSMVCCQENELRKKDCSQVVTRTNELLRLGANPKSNSANSTAASYTKLQDTDNSKFVVCVVSVMEAQMDNIASDTAISKVDREAIRGFVFVFYETHLETINKILCKQ